MHKTISPKPLLLIALSVAIALIATPSTADQLDSLVAEALANNSGLAAAKERWQQSTYKSIQVGSLKDPVLSLSLSNYPSDSLSSDKTPMTGNEVKLAQAFPYPGKLEAQSALAAEQSGWFKASYQDLHYQVARKVKDAWFRLYSVARAVEVTERNLELVDDIIRLTEVRYETGSGLQQDVLKAHIQHSRLTEKKITLQQQYTTIQAELDRLLARENPSQYGVPESLVLPTINQKLDEFIEASKERPLYSAYKSLLRRSQQQKRLAELDDYPDITLWGSWRFRDDDLPDKGTDFVSAGISFNLPVYRDKRRAALAEANAETRFIQRQVDDFRNGVNESINKAYARMIETREQAMLYKEGIIPQTSQSFQAALSSYQVGKVAFISLLDALMNSYNAEMEYYKLSAEYMRSLAWLEAESALPLLGAPVDSEYLSAAKTSTAAY